MRPCTSTMQARSMTAPGHLPDRCRPCWTAKEGMALAAGLVRCAARVSISLRQPEAFASQLQDAVQRERLELLGDRLISMVVVEATVARTRGAGVDIWLCVFDCPLVCVSLYTTPTRLPKQTIGSISRAFAAKTGPHAATSIARHRAARRPREPEAGGRCARDVCGRAAGARGL